MKRLLAFPVFVGALFLAAPASAGGPTPELDPSSLGPGAALALAIVLLLTRRGRAPSSHDRDRS